MKNIRTWLPFLLAVSLVLAACATKNIDRDYALSGTSGKGVVVGSMARSSTRGSFRLFYRQIPSGEDGYFAYGRGLAQLPSFDKDDFSGPHLTGAIFAAELPAGDYEIYGWHVNTGSAHISPTAPFSIRFHVLAGKAVYLGAFTFERAGSFLGTTTGVDVTCRDQRARDMPIFAAKYPNFAQIEIASSIEEGRSYENLGGDNSTYSNIYIPVVVPHR